MYRHSLIISLLLLLSITLFTSSVSAEPVSPEEYYADYPPIGEYLVTEEKVPGLTIEKEYMETEEDLKVIEEIVGGKLKTLVHQIFNTESKNNLNVNYLLCKDTEEANLIFEKTYAEVDGHPVLKKDNLIIEIFEPDGSTEDALKAVVEYFKSEGFE